MPARSFMRSVPILLSLALAAGCNGSSSSGHSQAPPPAAQAVASGGAVSTSAHYRLEAVLGEPTTGCTATSTHYRLQGGLVGAHGSLP